jgi:hypothetical protein
MLGLNTDRCHPGAFPKVGLAIARWPASRIGQIPTFRQEDDSEPIRLSMCKAGPDEGSSPRRLTPSVQILPESEDPEYIDAEQNGRDHREGWKRVRVASTSSAQTNTRGQRKC